MNRPPPDRCEICVVGAGPAGATIARRLAALGHDVVVIERATFPRPHIGESLPPSICPVLDLCGVRERVEAAGFLRPASAIVEWSGPASHRRYDGAPGFQVDRGRFDHLLLDAARGAGARVWQPARAGRPVATAEGWTVPVEWEGAARELRTRFLVDTAGKHASMPRHRLRSSVPTAALYGYWYGTGIHGPETRVEAGCNAWYWGAPLPDGSFNAVVFVDPEQCAGLGRRALGVRYRSLLTESRLLSACARGTLREPVRTCDASTYFDADAVTATSIKVGEAAFSIDPLSSQGVQAAMMSGFQAAAVVHTIRLRPADTEGALEFYRTRQRESVAQHQRIAGAQYAEHETFRGEPFWRKRALGPVRRGGIVPTTDDFDGQSRLEISPAARIVNVPTIDGDFIRRSDALEHPSLERSVAYLGRVALVPLLRQTEPGQTGTHIVKQWSCSLPSSHAWQILHWLRGREILTPAGGMAERSCP